MSRHALDRLDLVVSRVALAKEDVARPLLSHRVAVLERAAVSRPWLAVVVSDLQLIADIAEGYDLLVLGADKWAQIHDASFYGGSGATRDEALARLPQVVVVPREEHDVSSTGARAGRREWMAPEALAFDDETGAWTDPARYDAWLAQQA